MQLGHAARIVEQLDEHAIQLAPRAERDGRRALQEGPRGEGLADDHAPIPPRLEQAVALGGCPARYERNPGVHHVGGVVAHLPAGEISELSRQRDLGADFRVACPYAFELVKHRLAVQLLRISDQAFDRALPALFALEVVNEAAAEVDVGVSFIERLDRLLGLAVIAERNVDGVMRCRGGPSAPAADPLAFAQRAVALRPDPQVVRERERGGRARRYERSPREPGLPGQVSQHGQDAAAVGGGAKPLLVQQHRHNVRAIPGQ